MGRGGVIARGIPKEQEEFYFHHGTRTLALLRLCYGGLGSYNVFISICPGLFPQVRAVAVVGRGVIGMGWGRPSRLWGMAC